MIVTDQRSFSGCAFCSLDRLLFLLSDCFSLYTLCVSNSIGACSCRGNYITRYVGKILRFRGWNSLCFYNLFVDTCDVFHNLIGSLSFYSQSVMD